MAHEMIRTINASEHQIQCAIVEWARLTPINVGKTTMGKIGDYLIKNANEGKRSFSLAKKMKKEGLTSGVSDMFFAFPINIGKLNKFICPTPGLWIEVKSKKGKLSESQKIWIERMRYIGYQCVVINTVEEGMQAIKNYLGMRL